MAGTFCLLGGAAAAARRRDTSRPAFRRWFTTRGRACINRHTRDERVCASSARLLGESRVLCDDCVFRSLGIQHLRPTVRLIDARTRVSKWPFRRARGGRRAALVTVLSGPLNFLLVQRPRTSSTRTMSSFARAEVDVDVAHADLAVEYSLTAIIA